MWSARAKWKVCSGALETAVVLTQGSHADWEDVGGESESVGVEDSKVLVVLGQLEKPVPCEVTVDFPETSFFVSLIKLSSTARTCEIYTRKLGSQDHEYVCTVRGKEQEPPPASPAFITPLEADIPSPLKKLVLVKEGSAQSAQLGVSKEDSCLEPAGGTSDIGAAGGRNGKNQAPQTSGDLNMVLNHQPPKSSQNPTPSNLAPNANSLPSSSPSEAEKSLSNQPRSSHIYTCLIKLARGPALSSLRLKFLSLINKSELHLNPIRIYGSRGPAAAPPPQLTGNSLAAFAPLLPALGPLLNSGVPGLPTLPGGFSHLLSAQQTVLEHQKERDVDNGSQDAEGGGEGVNKPSASRGHSHQGGEAIPGGLAQLLASMQGLRAAGAPSQPAGGARSHLGGPNESSPRPAFDLAGLMAAVGNNRGGLTNSRASPGKAIEVAGSDRSKSSQERGEELMQKSWKARGV